MGRRRAEGDTGTVRQPRVDERLNIWIDIQRASNHHAETLDVAERDALRLNLKETAGLLIKDEDGMRGRRDNHDLRHRVVLEQRRDDREDRLDVVDLQFRLSTCHEKPPRETRPAD